MREGLMFHIWILGFLTNDIVELQLFKQNFMGHDFFLWRHPEIFLHGLQLFVDQFI